MSKRSSTHAMLGILALAPGSGYDLQQRIRRSIGHFWKASFGQIYPALAELESQGLVVRDSAPAADGRERTPFRITPAGLDALRTWLHEPVEPTVARNELLLKLYFARFVPPAVTIAHIRASAAHHAEALGTYRRLHDEIACLDQPEAERLPRLLSLRLGIAQCEATLAWCADAERELERSAAFWQA